MSELVARQTVSEMVAAYDQSILEIDQAFLLLESSTNRLDSHFGVGRLNNGLQGMEAVVMPTSPDRIKKDVTKNTWKYIIRQTGIETILTQKKAEELRNQLKSGDMPPITVENVMSTFKEFADNVEGFTEEVIKETFELLRPRVHPSRKGYKTNSEFEIGEKIILERYVEFCKFTKRFSVEYYHHANIQTIDNVFHLLDSKGHSRGQLLNLMRSACTNGEQEFETDYFAVKYFKKGTVHLTIKRPELLKELNRIGGGNRLKDAV